MIECCEENIYYVKRKTKKKKKRRFKKLAVFLVVLSVLICAYLYYSNLVTSQVTEYCKSKVTEISIESINKAVLLSLDEEVNYTDLVRIEKNTNGDISYMSANAYKINLINKEISENTKKLMTNSLKDGIKIPFGSFTGIRMLSGYGSEITFKSLSVEEAFAEFDSNFTSVGINQTLHSIYVTVKTQVEIQLPLCMQKIEFSNQVLISEAVLVGKVPEIYLNGKIF